MGKSKKKANTLAVAAVDAAASASPNTGKKGKREALSLAAQPSAKKLKSSNKVHPTKKIQETSSCEEEGCSQSHEQEEEPAGKQVALGKKGCVVAEKGSAADLNNGAAESSEDSSEDEFSDEKLVTKPISQLTEKQKSRNEEEISEEINEESAKQGSSSSEKEASEGSEEGSDEEIEGLEETPAPKKTSVQKDKSSTQKMPNTPATPGSKTLFLGNLAYSTDMDSIYQFFEDVVDVRLATKDDGSLRGYGHVDFATEEAAMKAMEKNGQELCGRCVKLDFARGRGAPSGKQDGNNSNGKGQKPTAFVRGFDKNQEEDDVRNSLSEHFKICGDIDNIRIPMDRESGCTKGFAYVEFKDIASLSKALELGDKKLSVEEAKERSGGRGGGRRGGGRFSGGRDRRGRGRGRGGHGDRNGSGKRTKFGDD